MKTYHWSIKTNKGDDVYLFLGFPFCSFVASYSGEVSGNVREDKLDVFYRGLKAFATKYHSLELVETGEWWHKTYVETK